VSQTATSLILVVLLIGLSFYWLIWPPAGFDEMWGHRLTVPIVLVTCAFTVFESLRVRGHMAQLIGVLRNMTPRSGARASPEVRREAIALLLKSLRSDEERVRATACAELKRLTGQDFGAEPVPWEGWWEQNRDTFR